jgi:hypothetical protein
MMTTIREEAATLAFAKDAAEAFAKNPQWATFTRDVDGHQLMALRWGMGEDCVRVIRVDAEFEPRTYQQAIPRGTA